jgi:hypothetical protein
MTRNLRTDNHHHPTDARNNNNARTHTLSALAPRAEE